jgi:hypothetical protein
MRRGLGVLTVAVLWSAVAGCSGGDGAGSAATPTTTSRVSAQMTSTTSTTAATTTSTTVACAADDADPSGLEQLLVDDIDGFQLQAASVGGTGPSDLLKAIRDDGQSDARQVLTDLRFRRGYQRLWRDQFGEELVLFVYEFCDDAGAAGHAGRAAEVLSATGPIEKFATEPFAAGTMSAFLIERNGVVAAFVDASAGAMLVQVITYARPETTRADVQRRAVTLAADQLALL